MTGQVYDPGFLISRGDEVRAWLLSLEWPGASRSWDALGEPLDSYGHALAVTFGLRSPSAAIAHRDSELAWHSDKLNPYPCMNLLLVFRDQCTGGDLVIRRDDGTVVTHTMEDRQAVVFDGQLEHRVTPIQRGKYGYRIGLTFYCPLDDAD